MLKLDVKKMCVAGIMVAVTIVLSNFSIPIGASRCYPIQHITNVLAAVFLGPAYGCIMAFLTSLLRNLMGTGTLLAFPGSMIGALFAGVLYEKTKNYIFTYFAEVIGTGIVGGLLASPLAILFMGKEATMFAFVIPFLLSTVSGTIIAACFIGVLYKTKALNYMKEILS